MIKRNDFGIEYDSNQKKIYFIDENGEKIEGNVDFNHERREIRLYNFRKTDLTVTQKAYIMYSIIEAEYLFPNYFKSNEIALGNITEYVFLINGYLSDGTFKEQNKKYKSIVEEIIESVLEITDESSINKLIHDINYFYNKYSNEIGKEEVDIYITGKGIIKSFVEYINFARLFAAYSKAKGKRFRLITNNKVWEKEKRIIVLPY